MPVLYEGKKKKSKCFKEMIQEIEGLTETHWELEEN